MKLYSTVLDYTAYLTLLPDNYFIAHSIINFTVKSP